MIEPSHYRARRHALFEHMMDKSMVLLFASPIQYRNADTEYPYRQQSYFYYLTGMEESEAIVVITKQAERLRYILFSRGKDEKVERWTGPRIGVQEAMEHYGVDEVYLIEEMSSRFPDMLIGLQTLYYLVGVPTGGEQKIFQWIEELHHRTRSGVQSPFHFIDLRVLLNEMRLIKQPPEIELMQKACDISASAHIQAMKACQAGMHEYELEAILLHEFYRRGSRYPAYPSIVAGGNNACILHYTKNNKLLKEGDLVLIDAGAEYHYYASDITRTFPVNGKFTRAQQAIYELVLASQTAALDNLRAGVSWGSIQEHIIQVLVRGLIDLNILKGESETLIAEKAYMPFYRHNSGHWLGMDVHDVGDYKIEERWRDLVPGMVLTVEPGLYLSHDDKNIPEAYRGIGVRIEDDILITENGIKNLTDKVPKTVSEIEKIMKDI